MSKPSREGSAVISDGYTRPAFLAGIPFTTPDVRFSYRPPLSTPLFQLRREVGKAAAKDVAAMQAKMICKYVKDWDVKDEKGEPVPLRPEALVNIDPIVFEGVALIVLGLRITDIDPRWETDHEEESTDIDEILAGENADTKNS